jgi:hypothetical protein
VEIFEHATHESKKKITILYTKGHSAQPDMFWRSHHTKPEPKSRNKTGISQLACLARGPKPPVVIFLKSPAVSKVVGRKPGYSWFELSNISKNEGSQIAVCIYKR